MARSRWKLAYFSDSTWRKIFFIKNNFYLGIRNKNHYIYERSSFIPSCFKFKTIKIHKGRLARRLHIVPDMFTHKFGEFSFTRKPYHFPLKKKRKKK